MRHLQVSVYLIEDAVNSQQRPSGLQVDLQRRPDVRHQQLQKQSEVRVS